MDDGELELWNHKVREYLEDTPQKLYTEIDMLVLQIDQANNDTADIPEPFDLDGFYDREIDELIRILEIAHSKMEQRRRIADRQEKHWSEE